MTKLEMKIQIILYNAKSPNGCRAGINSLLKLEKEAATVDESDLIRKRMDDLFVKGNKMMVEERG